MESKELFTVGYEGRQIDEFLNYLKSHKISRLIDVREIPISRKRGFSKSALKSRLEAERIEYLHFGLLGSPSSIRKKLKEDQDIRSFFEAFSKHLSSQSTVLDQVIHLAEEGNNCLLCFERQAENCHRSTVAQRVMELSNRNLLIHHI
jgi:uncharacterized protein (DUF488 family)